MPGASRLRAFLTITFVVCLEAAPAADLESRIDNLLARMTLDEKIGQMSQSTSMASPYFRSDQRRRFVPIAAGARS